MRGWNQLTETSNIYMVGGDSYHSTYIAKGLHMELQRFPNYRTFSSPVGCHRPLNHKIPLHHTQRAVGMHKKMHSEVAAGMLKWTKLPVRSLFNFKCRDPKYWLPSSLGVISIPCKETRVTNQALGTLQFAQYNKVSIQNHPGTESSVLGTGSAWLCLGRNLSRFGLATA